MADRIVVLRAGVIEQMGTPLNLYDRPANRFVASFLGSPPMNFLDGMITAAGTFAMIMGQIIALHSGQGLPAGQRTTMGLCPQLIYLAADNGFVAKVVAIEPTGAETHVIAEFAGQTLNRILQPHFEKSIGDELRLALDTKRASFFDAEIEAGLN